MITLSDPSHSIDFTCTAITTNQVEMVYAYVDSSFTGSIYAPVGNNASSAGPGPTTLISAPAAGLTRQVKYLSIANKDTVSNTFTWLFNVGGVRKEIRKVTLATLECLIWDGVTWKTYTSVGAEKVDSGVALVLPNMYPPGGQRIFRSALQGVAGAILASGTGYFVYVGQVAQPVTVKFVEFVVSTIGAGAQTAEVGLFSTPLAPNKANQSLTKIVATGTVDSLITTGVKRNTASFNQALVPGTHIWTGFRGAMATTQPQMLGLSSDYAQGQYLLAAASGVLTGAGPFTGVVQAADTAMTWRAPDLCVVQD